MYIMCVSVRCTHSTHRFMHLCAHRCIQYTRTDVHIHLYTPWYIPTPVHTGMYTHMCTHVYTRTHWCIHTSVCTLRCMLTSVHINVYIHTRTDVYMHLYTPWYLPVVKIRILPEGLKYAENFTRSENSQHIWVLPGESDKYRTRQVVIILVPCI